jgi:hypothetical protein
LEAKLNSPLVNGLPSFEIRQGDSGTSNPGYHHDDEPGKAPNNFSQKPRVLDFRPLEIYS